MAGLNVPAGTRCLIADVGGVGREYPLSMEKLSPILAFYVGDGLGLASNSVNRFLLTAGWATLQVFTRVSREAAVQFGADMPASRITVNTPTTHGAIGFSTALPPSMTLGCGSWGGNVTSDNVGPLHLMDIKRVAFETRPVQECASGVGHSPTAVSAFTTRAPVREPAIAGGKINRQEIAAIVDRFLAGKGVENVPASTPLPKPPIVTEAGSMYTGPAGSQKVTPSRRQWTVRRTARTQPRVVTISERQQAGDFVSEDDVRRAIQKGEKIYITAKTIITPAAETLASRRKCLRRFSQ